MAFPKDDPHWNEVLDLARKHIGMKDAVFAENGFLQFFPNALPYLLMTRRGMMRGGWIIFHKDYAKWISPRIMRDVQENYRVAFANEVFVVLVNKNSRAGQSQPWADFHPDHVEAVWKTVDALEKNPAPLRGMYMRMLTDYDAPPAAARVVKSAIQRVFSPKVMVVRLRQQGGFFASFNRVMSNLARSLHHDGIRALRVEWHVPETPPTGLEATDHFPYGKPGDGNIWEHFFEPIPTPSNPAWPEVETSFSADLLISGLQSHYAYKGGGGWRKKYHSAFRKYIRVRPRILAKVDEFHAANMAGRYVIGIHVRNQGHKIEYITGEAPGFGTYAARVRKEIAHCNREWVIFLATDVEEVIGQFKEAFDGRVVLQPGVMRLCGRQTGENGQQLHHQNPNRDLKLGEDVLIDCLLLSKCDVLIHTISNVATTAGYINPRMKMVYIE